MSMMEEARLNGLGVYPGSVANAPIGSYWNPATNAYKQLSSDGSLPACNTWIMVTNSGSSTASQIATAINGIISGLAYTSSNLHSYTSADNSAAPGTGANDA